MQLREAFSYIYLFLFVVLRDETARHRIGYERSPGSRERDIPASRRRESLRCVGNDRHDKREGPIASEMSHLPDAVCGRNLMTFVIAASDAPPESSVMKEQTGTTDQLEDQHKESTYALLIRSEEKSRNVIEMAIYPILILGAVIAIWQFAQQPVNIPAAGLDAGGCVACVDDLRALRQVRHPEVKG